jgi:hypothetical protein
MSLINDALKRAKAAQKNDLSAGGPPLEFRPVDPGQNTPKRPVWLIVAGVVAAVVLVGVLWKVCSTKEGPLKVEAKGVTAPTNSEATQASAPAGKSPIPPPEPKPTTYQPRTQALAGATSVALAEPPALKLQGIVFHPTRPSAVISGKTVFIGDKAGDFRVTAIGRDSVTVVSATETNVLTFAQ